MRVNVSLIIPSCNEIQALKELLNSIPDWSNKPAEIIVIDSSQLAFNVPKALKLFLSDNNINLILIKKDNLYPGHARNIGICKARFDTLAFLDTSTHPSKSWLFDGLKIIESDNTEGVWGITSYAADNIKAKIIRASTFGEKPIRTFPGSIIKRQVFAKCGFFIEHTRAGEDGDWIDRATLHQINMSNGTEVLNYEKLSKQKFRDTIKKWFRNYTHSSRLPNSKKQTDLYSYGVAIISIIVAYNWNSVMASWETDSVYYIPNVTKISAATIAMLYIIIRGIWLPLRKGSSVYFLFPINFIAITIVSAFLDATKLSAFVYSKLNK